MLRKLTLLAALTLAPTPVLFGQSEPDENPPPRATEVPTDGGFWPTPRMVERFIDRITEAGIGMGTYDAIQIDQTREILKKRVPEWMAENRAEIMSLTNEIFEAMLDKEPPTPEAMATWARRVLPVAGSFEQEIIGITDEMREFLSDDQLTVLDGEVAAFQTGLSMATNKVKEWADGRFDPKVDWIDGFNDEPPPPVDPPSTPDVEPGSVTPTGETPPGKENPASVVPPPAAPPDEWTVYTEEFIRKYELNSDQQLKARNHLRLARTNRDNYLSKPKTTSQRREVEELLKSVKDATGEDADKRRAEAEERKKKLDAPVENEFVRLKKKLDELPTREQRRKAAAAEPASTQPAETVNAAPEKPATPATP